MRTNAFVWLRYPVHLAASTPRLAPAPAPASLHRASALTRTITPRLASYPAGRVFGNSRLYNFCYSPAVFVAASWLRASVWLSAIRRGQQLISQSPSRPWRVAMASFMSNFFPGGKDKLVESSARPTTPKKQNSFVEPATTPQGSPSKKTIPPGAHDLPSTLDNVPNLNASAFEPPVKLRPQSVITTARPLSPGRSKVQPLDESNLNVDESVVHKGPSSGIPLKKHGQENTPPVFRSGGTDASIQHNHAALTRQQLYEPRERPSTPAKKFNTARGLTQEEREILQKPSVRRLVNVTQLCGCPLSAINGAYFPTNKCT